jgi:hypothetical protein
MAATRPLHLIRGGASLRIRHSRFYTVRAGRWPSEMARTQVTALAAPLHADRPADLAVDQAVDSAVDSRLSRGITRAFLWISWITQKILK